MHQFSKKLREISVSENGIDQIQTYFDVFQKWEGKVNISGHKTARDFFLYNILDSIYSFCSAKEVVSGILERPLVDVGCGGGFTGIVWQIMRKNQNYPLYLIDSDRRRISFCKDVIRELSLKDNVFAYHARIEELDDNIVNLDNPIIVSRAVWDLEKGDLLIREAFKKDCDVIFLKSTSQDPGNSSKYDAKTYKFGLDSEEKERLLVFTRY